MSAPVKLAVIGAGPWARAHALAAHHHPNIDLVGIWARRPEKSAALAAEVGTNAFSSIQELHECAEAVDICVPPAAQEQLAIDAAERGLHLMLEKPVADSLEGARRVAQACRQSGVVTQLMLTRRFHPATVAFLDQVRQELPVVDGVSAHYVHGAFLGTVFNSAWRLDSGVLVDLGPHLFDLMEQAAGPITDLSARRNDHDTLSVATMHAGGAMGSAMLSGSSKGSGSQRLLVFGHEGKVFFDAAVVDEDTAFANAFFGFARAINTGSSVVADVERGVQLQALIHAARLSLESGTWVPLSAV